MTLEPYDSQRLDAMTLRMLDLCTRVRRLALRCQEEQLPSIDLHDRKALEWLDKLEDWAYRAEAEVGRLAMKSRGERAAQKQRTPRAK